MLSIRLYLIYFTYIGILTNGDCPSTPGEDFYQDTITWIAWESSIQQKYEEKLSIVAWIHSHVQDTKYCKTRLEIYENIEKDFGSDMLGIVFQMNQENEHDIYYFNSKSKNGRFMHKIHECQENPLVPLQNIAIVDDLLLETHDFIDQKEKISIISHWKWQRNADSREIQQEKDKHCLSEKRPSAKFMPNISNGKSSAYTSGLYKYNDTNEVKKNSKTCDGCDITFVTESFLKHLSHSAKCKKAYGEDWHQLLKEKSETSSEKSIDKNKIILSNDETKEICEGCQKPFQPTAILKHVSHSKKCKAAYGSKFDEMKKEKESAKLKKYYQKNRDKILQSSNNYYKKHSAEDRKTTFKILSSRPKKEIQSETSVQCFGCKSIYGRNSILKHLAKAKRCYDFYSEEDLNSLKEESKVEWKMNVYEWQKEQKGEIAAQKSYRYKFFKKTPTDNPKEEKDDHDEESDDDFKC